MITKELENVLDALPSFLTINGRLENPLKDTVEVDKDYKPLEMATKAVWLIVPFHFVSLLGLVSPGKGEFTFVIILALAALIALMWLGTLIASVINKYHRIADRKLREAYVGNWVAGLFSVLFFCVLILSFANLMSWLFGKQTSGWPDLSSELESLLIDSPVPLNALMVLGGIVPILGCIAFRMFVLTGTKRGTKGQSFRFLAVCWMVCASLIVACELLSAPVTSPG